MKITFFNSACVKVPKFLVCSGWRGTVDLKVRFAVIEHDALGVIIIDGGYGYELWTGSASLPLKLYRSILKPRIEMSPLKALKKLGRRPEEVTHVIISHLHADHVCGLEDFRNAKYLMSKACRDAYSQKSTAALVHNGIFRELFGNLVVRSREIENAPTVDAGMMDQRGFDLLGDGSIVAVSLSGHGIGHYGFLFPKMDRELLYAVDVAWDLSRLRDGNCARFPASLIVHDTKSERESLEKVRAFMKRGGDVVLCHDPMPCKQDWRSPDAD